MRRRATNDRQLRVRGVPLAPPGHRRSPVARARRTSRAAGPPTITSCACAAYVSRRRATNDRRPGVRGAPLAPRDHRSAPER
ncbi:hypothetical protein MLP_47570 [Microlunatus phosphovorus NM-1]|uniref:Uncharacterized protein n=1 Tax=Microlunatus phosphovorus (strain ATCC 700054 / DSM 10555 / JCM 9379 / NBRC 101784 / NCIMB 13414 / VKM Ac-1990 / NM-1) TaxID=1032480 RepID=F5XF33_MICPN|nr:hypothetical protein MLP_47570 [Microlunatus phosphovorus NM-1]